MKPLFNNLKSLGMHDESPAPMCGDKIIVTNVGSNDNVGGNGNSVTVVVEDTCPSCASTHLDLSIGAWNILTDGAEFGTINIKWYSYAL
jgi:expansin (peptidoglycan-binding protein)